MTAAITYTDGLTLPFDSDDRDGRNDVRRAREQPRWLCCGAGGVGGLPG